ncbi:MAG: hypothetical protein ACKE9I_00425 [Methylophagaceae bacterium]
MNFKLALQPSLFIFALCFSLSQKALSQTPSDLAALSLQELMGISIDDDTDTVVHAHDHNERWSISYGYQRLELDGYRNGTDNLSDETAIFRPPEARTTTNYPILPTVITQEVHTLNLNYKLNEQLHLGITAPYILQSTEHKSIVPGFDEFTIRSEGVGDVAINVAYTLPLADSGRWKLLAAVSLPTGSISETGDTPRNGAGTKERLPYTMQLGSGTYDFPLSIQYSNVHQQIHYGGQLSARIRTGKNNEGYRLGNTYGLNSWARWMTNSWFHPGLSIAYRHADKIQGRDDRLTVAGLFPFPANITDPDNYGADKVDLGASIRICSQKKHCLQYIDLNISKAVYQRLNGVQIKEGAVFGLTSGINF